MVTAVAQEAAGVRLRYRSDAGRYVASPLRSLALPVPGRNSTHK